MQSESEQLHLKTNQYLYICSLSARVYVITTKLPPLGGGGGGANDCGGGGNLC